MAENFGASSSSLTPDKLIAGARQIVSSSETLLSGVGALTRGALVGRINCGSTSQAYSGTGNGTLGSISLGIYAKPGDYKLKCVTAVTNAGVFAVTDPFGVQVGTATVGAAFTSQDVNFTITDGATDFVVGDTFTLTVASGSGKLKLFSISDVVGAAVPYGILAGDADSTSADVVCTVYRAGEFSEQFVSDNTSTNYSGLTAAQKLIVKNQLRSLGIELKDSTRTA